MIKKSPDTEKYKKKQANMLAAAQEYIAGAKIKDVIAKYNVCWASVFNAIKKHNLQYTKTFGRTIFFNQDYFQNIDTEHKAYWLGFCFADGCISQTDKHISQCNRLRIVISSKDEYLLQQFVNDIELPQGSIKHYTQNGYSASTFACVNCNSIKLVDDLLSHGYTVDKKDRNAPIGIPDNLIPHFIRGFFDGDGSVYGNFRQGHLSFTSCEGVIQYIANTLSEYCNVPRTHIRTYRNAYEVRWGGRQQILRIANFLYNQATIFLPRKLNALCRRCFRNELDYISDSE